MTRDELIAALESADRGSHELDAKVIAHLISGTAEYSERAGIWYVCRGVDRHGDPRSWEPKLGWESALWRTLADRRGPTRSLDAALLLVPPEYFFMTIHGRVAFGYQCLLGQRAELEGNPIIHSDDPAVIKGFGSTRELCLCIAALRARKEIADAL